MAKWKVEIEGHVHQVDVQRLQGGQASVVVDGVHYDVAWHEEEAQTLAPVAGASAAPEPLAPAAPVSSPGLAPRGVVASPLPGLILGLHVEVGDQVDQGQVVLTIEAMKMANEVRSPVQGRVAEILTSVGETVEEGAHLVRIG